MATYRKEIDTATAADRILSIFQQLIAVDVSYINVFSSVSLATNQLWADVLKTLETVLVPKPVVAAYHAAALIKTKCLMKKLLSSACMRGSSEWG